MIGIIPGFPVTSTNAFTALKEVYYSNPGALIQIGLAISAVEVLGASIESKGGRPGDFGCNFIKLITIYPIYDMLILIVGDPANIRPSSPEALDELQLKELKNGRLAMLSIAGMAYQTYVTGQGTIEQLTSGMDMLCIIYY